ncbi:hypothetical protein J5069_04230 [Candidatus Symbiopectobacterium sp. NZEC127]|uniref:hypothetical protein n=1 Tax=Candidatus Symbiopectobacterium sp. NZEC127 TaxID=2820472 RepID=UPI0022262F7C|nr:hypothetical protein [Candidatus Symbiopectobacterium sp. NZEC127]MCW2485101.1 hypothetical protein [Candidatus Symbiopectobacterium sp. NZEC127]
MQVNIERAHSLPFESFLMPNHFTTPPRPVSLDIAHIENTVDERSSETSSNYSLSQLSTLSQLSMVYSSSDSLSGASTPASPSPIPLISSPAAFGIEATRDSPASREVSNAESLKQRGERYASNMGAVLLRNSLSVAVGTGIREYVRRGALSETFANLPRSSLALISSIIIATPLVLHLSGLARDYFSGGLNGSVFMGRLSSLLFVAVTGMCLWYSNNFEHAALLLVAGLAYVLLRDIAQFIFPLRDNNSDQLSLAAVTASGILYSGNQTMVDIGMDIATNALSGSMSGLMANIVGRSAVNLIGEFGDEFCYRGINAFRKKNPALNVTLAMRNKEDFTRKAIMDCTLNTIASRASIIVSAYAAASALPFGGYAASAIVGSTMGTAYAGFAYAHNQNRKNPLPETVEMEDIKTEEKQDVEQQDVVKRNAMLYL